MKAQISPIIAVVLIVIVVGAIAVWGYRIMQPAPYMPSPGVGGTPAAPNVNYGTPGAPNPQGASGVTQSGQPYNMPPADATPGKPLPQGSMPAGPQMGSPEH